MHRSSLPNQRNVYISHVVRRAIEKVISAECAEKMLGAIGVHSVRWIFPYGMVAFDDFANNYIEVDYDCVTVKHQAWPAPVNRARSIATA